MHQQLRVEPSHRKLERIQNPGEHGTATQQDTSETANPCYKWWRRAGWDSVSEILLRTG